MRILKLIPRLREQAGLSDAHNLDLTFSVLFNLASQYDNNEMYTEALNTYSVCNLQHLPSIVTTYCAGDNQEPNV